MMTVEYEHSADDRQRTHEHYRREVHTCNACIYGWWRGVVGNAFRLKRSYFTPGPVSTAMGDCLRAVKPSRCEACQLGRLSLLPSVGR